MVGCTIKNIAEIYFSGVASVKRRLIKLAADGRVGMLWR